MSRSRRKTPILGHTPCRSEREDKKLWHQRWRTRERVALASASPDASLAQWLQTDDTSTAESAHDDHGRASGAALYRFRLAPHAVATLVSDRLPPGIELTITNDQSVEFGEVWQGKGLTFDLLSAALCPANP